MPARIRRSCVPSGSKGFRCRVEPETWIYARVRALELLIRHKGVLVPALDPTAGKPVTADALANIPKLVTAYFAAKPDPAKAAERVAFGTSGHRGSSLRNSFNEDHILAITQAICEYRKSKGYDGPLYMGMDTHGLSEPAQRTALEVLAAHDVAVHIA